MKAATFCYKRRLFIKTTHFYNKKKLLCTSLEKNPTSNISIYKKKYFFGNNRDPCRQAQKDQ